MKPVLFLDFDRTLFDTDQLYTWLGEDRFARILGLTSGTIDPPDFATYLYPDTVDFLKKARESHRVVLATFAVNTVLQRKKIRGSGIIPLLDDVIVTSGDDNGSTGKGRALRDYLLRIGDPGWEHTFVDDAGENIDEVKRMNPEIRCVRIDRNPLMGALLHDGHLAPDYIVNTLPELYEIL